ncbi:MAG: hypothetical protein H0V89_03260 [Deltaproteobacteria bacterium]|nr:hypothetical protein [Deltaproteobacteria bacterium]
MDERVKAAIEALLRAFPPAALEPSEALREWGRTYTDHEAFERGVSGRTWVDLPAAFLERQHDALPFLGPRSFATYLPAYVTAVLRRGPELDALPGFLAGTLTRDLDDGDRFDARVSALSGEQRRAIARALEALEASATTAHDRARWSAALDGYWRSVASETAR